MTCPLCKKSITPVRIGASIGATQLKACPECGVVFIEVNKRLMAEEYGKDGRRIK